MSSKLHCRFKLNFAFALTSEVIWEITIQCTCKYEEINQMHSWPVFSVIRPVGDKITSEMGPGQPTDIPCNQSSEQRPSGWRCYNAPDGLVMPVQDKIAMCYLQSGTASIIRPRRVAVTRSCW